jgi:glutamate:GABA antiporter
MYIAGTFAILALVPAADLDPQSGVFHAITIGSIALRIGFLGVLAAILVTVGNAGGVGSTVAGIARVPFVVGIDRYLPAAFGKIHPRWKTPYISILVQAILSGAILLGSQINDSTRGAYQKLIDAAIILYFIPFLYMFAAVIKLAAAKTAKRTPTPSSFPAASAGVWICGGLGFLVVLVGIFVSSSRPVTPPAAPSSNSGRLTTASILIGLILYWRGARPSPRRHRRRRLCRHHAAKAWPRSRRRHRGRPPQPLHFQPLLYQVALAVLSPADIAQPIRTILRNNPTPRS